VACNKTGIAGAEIRRELRQRKITDHKDLRPMLLF
jgi:hypothetical protein